MSFGCPACGLVGKKPASKPKPKEKPKTQSDWEAQRDAKREKARQEIAELWQQATLAFWNKDRRRYIELMKIIKRKENLHLIKED